MNGPAPTAITLHQASRRLEIAYDDHAVFSLPFEYLRVHSPSAEVQGHSPDQAVLQLDKENVTILCVRPVGHYAICPTFSDGHDSGIFTFEYLYELGLTQDSRWAAYQEAVRAHRATASPLPACGLNPKETPHD
jgi:DUF971 family protein